jgi:uncharacterized SAM-binding protein YcdF (DUF218 family)
MGVSTPPTVRSGLDRHGVAAVHGPVDCSRCSSRRCWGLFRQKERWGLSWRGWLLLTSAGLVAAYFAFLNVHPFLAVTHRVDTNVLVVEGWIQRYAIREGAAEFKNGSYERVFTTGGPVRGLSSYVNDFQTSASVGAEALKKLGLSDEMVQMVPSHVIARDRTYSSAVALRDWFRDHNLKMPDINVLTEDVHARRTRLLFQKALGDHVRVGIIAISNPDYDAKQWWRYSDGVREVIGESIAYIYARFFFWPQAEKPREKGDGSLTEQEKEMEVGR